MRVLNQSSYKSLKGTVVVFLREKKEKGLGIVAEDDVYGGWWRNFRAVSGFLALLQNGEKGSEQRVLEGKRQVSLLVPWWVLAFWVLSQVWACICLIPHGSGR